MADSAAARAGRGRLIAARTLTVIGVLFAIVTILATYLRWQAFDDQTFNTTAEELIANPTIRERVATRISEDFFANVDVEKEIAARLPADQKGLAVPIAAAIELGGSRFANELLSRPLVQDLWVKAASVARQEVEDILDDETGPLTTENGEVILDLRPIVIALGDKVAVIGDLSKRLPPDAGRIRIVQADKLETAQDVTRIFKSVAAWIWIVPLALWAAAIWLARGRRRIEVRAIAIGAIVAAIVVLVLRKMAGTYLVDDLVPREDGKPAAQQAWDIITSLLADGAWSVFLLGIVALVGAWLVGPSKAAGRARAHLAPILARADLTYGIVALAILLLGWWGPIAQTRRWLYMVVFTVLLVAGVEVVRRFVSREQQSAARPPGTAGQST